MNELTIPERVKAGAEWLDVNRPGWVDRINLGSLDLGSTCNCVLGQEYGYYADSPRSARYDAQDIWLAYRRGFDVSWVRGDNDYAELTAEWRRLIESRRSGAGWKDDATGLISGGLVASCSVCGHIDESEPHDCGAVS